MKSYKAILSITVSVFLMSTTCRKGNEICEESGHFSFTLKNNSARKLNIEMYFNTYPDTLIGEYNPSGFGFIKPYQQKEVSSGPGLQECWEAVLKDGKKEYLYIFDEDSLQAIPWKTVRATNRGLLVRKEISLQYLQDNNFTIIYE